MSIAAGGSSDDTSSTQPYNARCNRQFSRAARQLFRQDASSILLHYFGERDRGASWREAVSISTDAKMAKVEGGRERIPLVNHPDDGLRDDEWYSLLSYAIDYFSNPTGRSFFCPLHPKNDATLPHDFDSYIIRRRYRSGASVTKFGALSLPYSGRAARAAMWIEERSMNGQSHTQKRTIIQKGSGSVFLFQCGVCGKTFVSQFYLDQHMESNHFLFHRSNSNDSIDAPSFLSSSNNSKMICPDRVLCANLGGISSCAEIVIEISPYYGRGTIRGSEFANSIVSRFHHGHTDDAGKQPKHGHSRDGKSLNKVNLEKDFATIIETMHRRSLNRIQIATHALQRQLLKLQQSDKDPIFQKYSFGEKASKWQPDNDGNALDEGTLSFSNESNKQSSCDEMEMNEKYSLCLEMILGCFSKDSGANAVNMADKKSRKTISPTVATDRTISNSDSVMLSNLASDLIMHICEPIKCHHRLHRMAGHFARHRAHWNEEWESHHSFALQIHGWLALLVVIFFYGCAFLGGGESGDDDNVGRILPTNRLKKNKYQ